MKSSILLTVLAGSLALACPAPKVGGRPSPVQKYHHDDTDNDVATTTSAAASYNNDDVPDTTTTTAAASTTAAAVSVTTGTSSSSDIVVGKSTYYGGNLHGGNCAFSTYTLPSGIYGTAFSNAAWDSSAKCGDCILVTGPKGTIKAMIVDKCPECDEGHLDLFYDAFAAIGNPVDGIIPTSYEYVDCGISSPIVLRNKEGTSKYWFSMQVVNSNKPVASLEVSIDGGSSWLPTTRSDYNFFENSSGYGTDTVDVRVKCTGGSSIVVKNVPVTADAEVTADSNF